MYADPLYIYILSRICGISVSNTSLIGVHAYFTMLVPSVAVANGTIKPGIPFSKPGTDVVWHAIH